MPISDVSYPDLGGGLNQDAAPAAVARREMVELKNFYPYDTRLRRRGAVTPITDDNGAFPNGVLTAIHPLKLSDGTWVLIGGGIGSFGKLDGTAMVELEIENSSTQPGASNYPWVFYQYKNYLYAVRHGGSGKMYRVGLARVREAGIAAPLTGPTIAQGAAGSLVAGDYRAVVTFHHMATGYESNPGPESNVLTLAASKKIDYTNIPISSNPFVDSRRVYRTLENQRDVYFRVFQLNDNTTTAFTGENVVVSGLGPTVSFKNGVPPANLRVAVAWQERIFASDGRDLFYSEILMGEGFGGDSVFTVFPDDGHEIRALHALGERLIIGKTNKIHYLLGTSAGGTSPFSLHTLSDKHGCMSHHSMQSAEGSLFWYGSGKAVYRSEGSGARDISTPRIKRILEAINDDREEYIVGTVYPRYNWYMLSVPDVTASGLTGNNHLTLVYNYRSDAWTVFDHLVLPAPQHFGGFFNEEGAMRLYSTHYDGKIYNFHNELEGKDRNLDAIRATFTTRLDDCGAPGYRKMYDAVWILVPQVPSGQLRLEVLRDALTTATVDRMVSIDIPGSGFKAFKIPTWATPGTNLQLRATYEGAQAIDIDQLVFKVAVSRRGPGQPR